MNKIPTLPNLPPLLPGQSRTIIISSPAPEDVEYRFGVERQDGVLVGTILVEDANTGEQVSKLNMSAEALIPELETWLRDLKTLCASAIDPALTTDDREKA